MRAEGIPITPGIVTWARKRAGFSLAELAEKFRDIEAWEAGTASPTYPQLEHLADSLKVPVAVFFFPEPPSLPPLRESFRTLPESEFDQIPPRVRFLLRKAKAMQLSLAELSHGRNTARRLLTVDLSFRPDTPTEVMASGVRDYLGVSLAQQCGWANDEVALENWRKVFTDSGIFVFKDAFSVDEYSGFCLYDGTFPIIYVNNSAPKTRQIFTLFHELAHLIFHTSGIDTLTDSFVPRLPEAARRIEVVCNRFAALFLVPDSNFETAMVGRDASEKAAEDLAAYFHVSRELIYRKFLDRNLIDENTYKRAAQKWARQRKRREGGDYYNTQFAYLGPYYINLALSQYHQNRIDDIQLADHLNISAKNVKKFEERFTRRGR